MHPSAVDERQFPRIRRGLLTAYMSVMALSAGAQTTTPPPSDKEVDNSSPIVLDRYNVTGTNIPTTIDALATPITRLDQAQIITSGVNTNALDLLRKIAPSIGGIGSENASINTAQTYGGAEINNHGFPVLVLLDGRRVASSTAETVGGDRFVDLNMFPPSAIERIDILQDGASAIYGSDAVGGVVNVILKKNYNGWETNAHFGFSQNDGHYRERSGSVIGGVSDGKSSITVTASYTKSDPLYFKDRPYTNPYFATEYYPGIIDIYNLATGVDEDYMLQPSLNAPPAGGIYTIDQLVANGTYIDLGSDGDSSVVAKIQQGFNLADYQTLIASLERKSLTSNFSRKVFSDNLEFFGQLNYTETFQRTSLNAQPIYPYVSTPYTDSWYVGETPPPPGTQYAPVSFPGNPFSAAWIDQGAPADQSAGYGVDAHTRFVDFPRIFEFDSTLFRAVGGLRGEFADNYSWEIGETVSRDTIDYSNANVIDTANFLAAIAAGQLNPFAIQQPSGTLPGNIMETATANGLSAFYSTDFVFRGTPFELPGGLFGFAIGGSYSRETLSATADLNTVTNGWLDSPSILPINKQRSDTAFFAEVEIPLVSKKQDIPGLSLLSVDIAGRTDAYSQVGRASVPQASLKYQPFDKDLTFRVTTGKSFIAPTLYYLYGPVNVGSSQSINFTPYGSTTPQSNVQFEASGGSNVNLKPSTAKTWTAGLAYSPKQVKGMSVDLDYFNISQTGIVGLLDQQTIAQSVEDLGAASPYVSYLRFGSATGTTATAPGQVSGHPKGSVWLITDYVNLSGQTANGFDGTIEYEHATDAAGTFDLTSKFTIYNSVRYKQMPTEPWYQYAGTDSRILHTIPRWTAFSTLSWKLGGWEDGRMGGSDKRQIRSLASRYWPRRRGSNGSGICFIFPANRLASCFFIRRDPLVRLS